MFDELLIQLAKPWVWLKLAGALIATFAVWRLGRSLLRLMNNYMRHDLVRILRMIWVVMCLFAALSVSVYAIYLPNVEVLFDVGQELVAWFRNTVGQLIAIVALTVIAWNVLSALASRIIPSGGDDFTRRSVRLQTLRGVIESTLRVILVLVATISILQAMGINATSLLAGVSVLGVAVGFGAQSLVKDVFNGFFILLEDQYGVGDVITVNNGALGGMVEKLNLRVTNLRALDGTVNIIPNGQIQTVSISSKDWSQVLADVDITYSANINDGLRVLQQVSRGLYDDPEWHDMFLQEPDMQGVVSLTSEGITLRALFKVLPKTQYALQREFNRRIKIAMDQANIEIPFLRRPMNSGDTISIRLLRGDADTHEMTVITAKESQRIEDKPIKPSESRDPESGDEDRV